MEAQCGIHYNYGSKASVCRGREPIHKRVQSSHTESSLVHSNVDGYA